MIRAARQAYFSRRQNGGGTQAGCSLPVAAGFHRRGCQFGPAAYPDLMPNRFPEIILLALIFLAVGVALMLFIGPILRMLGWPS